MVSNPGQEDNDGAAGWPWLRDTPGSNGLGPGDACDPDDDNDGANDLNELGSNELRCGDRDPLDPWDVFDVPTPALMPAETSGTRNRFIDIGDVLATLVYIGTWSGSPTRPNLSGVIYGSDLNVNGISDGVEYDRSASSDVLKPWQSGPPDGTVSIGDALTMLAQVRHNCLLPPG
jgi:hypothetical protein